MNISEIFIQMAYYAVVMILTIFVMGIMQKGFFWVLDAFKKSKASLRTTSLQWVPPSQKPPCNVSVDNYSVSSLSRGRAYSAGK